MKPHLQYLRYVLMHKLYVFAAGVVIARAQRPAQSWLAWLWRLLVHDLSKFRPSEWRPYVANFYGKRSPYGDGDPRGATEARKRAAAFNRAWLFHIHRNPHHWQHWVLHEDSGKTLVLLPEAWIVDEMVADWMGAGTKILAWPSLDECIAETVKWYAANQQRMQLREPVRRRVEETLLMLAERSGLVTVALELHAAEQARASIVIPGR